MLLRQPLDEQRVVRDRAADVRQHRAVAGGVAVAAGEVVGQRLAAAVEDDPIGRRPAHDARQHGQRAVPPRRRSQRDLRAIDIRVVARPQFRDPGLPDAESRGRRRSDADLLAVHARQIRERSERPRFLDGDRFRVGV